MIEACPPNVHSPSCALLRPRSPPCRMLGFRHCNLTLDFMPMVATDPHRGDSGQTARLAIRAGTHRGATSGLAPGFVQGNLAILPQALAGDFLRFCQLNPKPCPLIGSSAPGDWRVPELAADLDIRTDLPRYRVWKHGELVEEPEDLLKVWRDDLVAFVICT